MTARKSKNAAADQAASEANAAEDRAATEANAAEAQAAAEAKVAAVEVYADPENKGTVILGRWPDESEKDEEFKERVAKARKGG